MTARGLYDIPVPQGLYTSAARHGDLIFTAGMTPRRNGELKFQGLVAKDCDVVEHKDAVILACDNALSAARAMLAEREKLSMIMNLTVFIAAEPGFSAHSKLADFASEYLKAELGIQAIGPRAAIGVSTLPGNAP